MEPSEKPISEWVPPPDEPIETVLASINDLCKLKQQFRSLDEKYLISTGSICYQIDKTIMKIMKLYSHPLIFGKAPL